MFSASWKLKDGLLFCRPLEIATRFIKFNSFDTKTEFDRVSGQLIFNTNESNACANKPMKWSLLISHVVKLREIDAFECKQKPPCLNTLPA